MVGEIDIKALRSNLGMTQTQLGEAVGVDQSTVSTWENGATPRGPARILLQNLADTLPANTETAA